MRHQLKKAIGLLAIAAFLMVGAAHPQPQTQTQTQRQSQLAPRLFAYDFNLVGTPAVRADHLRSLGFRGVVTRVHSHQDLSKLEAYVDHTQTDFFEVLAFVPYDFSNPSISDVWIQALPTLAQADAPLWVILRNAPSASAVQQLLWQMATLSKSHGIPTVIYPHWDTDIETAAEASALINAIGHPNLWNSLHTCHEIRGGNQYQLDAVTLRYAKESALVTIAGAEQQAYAGPALPGIGWADAIMPLDEGDFSLLRFLQALHDAQYRGPVILHTFGILNNPGHLERSILRYSAYGAEIR